MEVKNIILNHHLKDVVATEFVFHLIEEYFANDCKKFFLFSEPCNHRDCKPESTIQELFGLSKYEIIELRKKVACKTTYKNLTSVYRLPAIQKPLIITHRDGSNRTWYEFNEVKLLHFLACLQIIEDCVTMVANEANVSPKFLYSNFASKIEIPDTNQYLTELDKAVLTIISGAEQLIGFVENTAVDEMRLAQRFLDIKLRYIQILNRLISKSKSLKNNIFLPEIDDRSQGVELANYIKDNITSINSFYSLIFIDIYNNKDNINNINNKDIYNILTKDIYKIINLFLNKRNNFKQDNLKKFKELILFSKGNLNNIIQKNIEMLLETLNNKDNKELLNSSVSLYKILLVYLGLEDKDKDKTKTRITLPPYSADPPSLDKTSVSMQDFLDLKNIVVEMSKTMKDFMQSVGSANSYNRGDKVLQKFEDAERKLPDIEYWSPERFKRKKLNERNINNLLNSAYKAINDDSNIVRDQSSISIYVMRAYLKRLRQLNLSDFEIATFTYDFVSGWKMYREHPKIKTFGSRLYVAKDVITIADIYRQCIDYYFIYKEFKDGKFKLEKNNLTKISL
ncbi:MAG TPA: hypothetical protein PKV92_07470 [Thermodesulfovibrio thiophilus]|nr:hypothetical protein [Thermodesulfovibrio thiophilus]